MKFTLIWKNRKTYHNNNTTKRTVDVNLIDIKSKNKEVTHSLTSFCNNDSPHFGTSDMIRTKLPSFFVDITKIMTNMKRLVYRYNMRKIRRQCDEKDITVVTVLLQCAYDSSINCKPKKVTVTGK